MKRLLLLTLAACAPVPMEAPAPGVPDPAGLYCAKQGGTLDARQTDAGEVIYCILPDGREVEVQAFWRASTL